MKKLFYAIDNHLLMGVPHFNYSKIPITYEKKIRILNSAGNGSNDIYWVDAKLIEGLKPKKLN